MFVSNGRLGRLENLIHYMAPYLSFAARHGGSRGAFSDSASSGHAFVIIGTWNVNSIHARLHRVIPYLERTKPEILCLQEIKGMDDKFPYAAFAALGYSAHVFGQKSYNGVAILTRGQEGRLLFRGWGEPGETEARLLSVEWTLGDGRPLVVVSVYVPNGRAVGHAEYNRKLAWLTRLQDFLATLRPRGGVLVVCGDFNITPDDRDVHDPERWREAIFCSTPERQRLAELSLTLELSDLWRLGNPEARQFTWWDYRQLAFPRNEGLRIDLLLGDAGAARALEKVWIDRDERRGEKPSDHAPVCAQFKFTEALEVLT